MTTTKTPAATDATLTHPGGHRHAAIAQGARGSRIVIGWTSFGLLDKLFGLNSPPRRMRVWINGAHRPGVHLPIEPLRRLLPIFNNGFGDVSSCSACSFNGSR